MASARAVLIAESSSSALRATFMPRPPPPAAAFTRTGIAHVLGDPGGFGNVGDRAVRAGHDRDAEALGRRLGLDLVAHDADMLGCRADEGDVVAFQDLGKAGVLGQEAVAGMDGVSPGYLARGHQARDVEVAFRRRRRADADAFIRQAHVHGVRVGRGMHGDRSDADFSAGAQYSERDLAAIGDQHLVEHRCEAAPQNAIL